MNKKLISNAIINYLSVGSVVIVQLSIVFFYTRYSSIEIYGQWVLLFTIPGYLSIAEFGVSAIMGTRMTKSKANKYEKMYSSQFYSSLLVYIMNFMLITLVYTAYLFSGYDIESISSLDDYELKLSIAYLLLYVLFCWLCNFLEAICRSIDQMSTGSIATSIVRLFEIILPVMSLIKGGGIYDFAFFLLVSRVFLSVVMYVYIVVIKVKLNKVKFRKKIFSHAIKLYLRGVSFLTFPIGHALLLQGVTLLIAAAFGPSSVAIFNISRTLSRLLVQSAAAINKAFWPRLTKSAIESNLFMFVKYYRMSLCIVAFYSLIATVFVYQTHELIISYWTDGNAVVNGDVLLLLLICASTTSIWQCNWVSLMSLDRSKYFGYYFLLFAFMTMCLFVVFIKHLSISDLVFYLIVLDIVLLVISQNLLSKEIKRKFHVV